MNELGGKVAVVTGAASGIGRALAQRFGAEGMKVVMADVERPALEAAAEDMRAGGAEILAVPTDVSAAEEVDALAERTLEAFGAVHVVCNNAGVATGGLSWELTPSDWQWVLGVNLMGVVNGLRSFVPRLLEQGEGHVVNTASMAGLTSAPGMAPYNVSKHGVVTLSETMHRELMLMGANVRVSVLCPGWVNTAISEAERNRPSELAHNGGSNPMFEAVGDFLRQTLSQGIAPSAVADLVLDAVRNDRFYILTHPEWKSMVAERLGDILEERTPGLTTLPPT